MRQQPKVKNATKTTKNFIQHHLAPSTAQSHRILFFPSSLLDLSRPKIKIWSFSFHAIFCANFYGLFLPIVPDVHHSVEDLFTCNIGNQSEKVFARSQVRSEWFIHFGDWNSVDGSKGKTHEERKIPFRWNQQIMIPSVGLKILRFPIYCDFHFFGFCHFNRHHFSIGELRFAFAWSPMCHAASKSISSNFVRQRACWKFDTLSILPFMVHSFRFIRLTLIKSESSD